MSALEELDRECEYARGFQDGAKECDRLLSLLIERYTAVNISASALETHVVTWQPGPRMFHQGTLLEILTHMADES